MASVEQKIQDAASRNRELLSTLTETDYALPALDQQKRYITDLEHELKRLDTEIDKLEKSRKKELKDHEKYRDSVMKRFAYKMTRNQAKFEAKASKEEREYFAALQEEHQAKEVRTSTQKTLSDAQTAKSHLESVAAQHQTAQKQLDELYDSIFEGPTPGFPDEDAREQSAEHALQAYHSTRTMAEAEKQVFEILQQASRKMDNAAIHMDDARSHSRMDMFGGGSFVDMMERSALHKAEQNCLEAQLLVAQAQRLSPHVQAPPRPSIAQGNLMSDVFFDNIFTDMAFHDKIKASQIEVQRSHQAMYAESQKAKARVDDLESRLKIQSKELEGARVALQKARELAFERVSSGSINPNAAQQHYTDAPPSYQA